LRASHWLANRLRVVLLRSVRREQAGGLFDDQLGVFTAQQPPDEKDNAQQHVDDVIHLPKHQQ
jgi:hypothetical protein